MDVNKTGKFLAILRKSQGYTQQEVADYLNISNKTISKWEQGKGYPELTVLPVLAEFYHVSVDEILAGEKMNRQTEPDHQRGAALRRHLLSKIQLHFDLFMVAVLVPVLSAIFFPFKIWCVILNLLAGGILLAGILMVNYELRCTEGILEKSEYKNLLRAVGQKTFLAIGLIMWSALTAPFFSSNFGLEAILRSHAWVILCTAVMAMLWTWGQKRWGSFFDHTSGIFCVAGLVVLNVTAPVSGPLWYAIWHYLGEMSLPDDRILQLRMVLPERIVLLIHFLGVALIAAGVIRQLVKNSRK